MLQRYFRNNLIIIWKVGKYGIHLIYQSQKTFSNDKHRNPPEHRSRL